MSAAPLPTRGATASPDTRRTIPFDYSFTYKFPGNSNIVLTKKVDISIEAAFTAVAIGYGFIPEIQEIPFGPAVIGDLDVPQEPVARPQPAIATRWPRAIAIRPHFLRSIPPVPIPPDTIARLKEIAGNAQGVRQGLQGVREQLLQHAGDPLTCLPEAFRLARIGTPRSISVGDIIRSLARELNESSFTTAKAKAVGPLTAAALQNGIRLNPAVARYFLQNNPDIQLDPDQLAQFFITVPTPAERVQFLYALHDDATGREFQSEPILNIAGLGIADGDRPFRYFAQPITFSPRSAVRLDITTKSTVKGELHVSLHGYKVLGGSNTPTGDWQRRRRRLHR
jgi:hypothetical protein